MQQNAGPAGSQDHFHFTGRGFDRGQRHDGLARCLAGEVFGRLLFQKEFQFDAPAAAAGTTLDDLPVFSPLGQAKDAQAGQRLEVARDAAVGRDGQHVAHFVGIPGAHLPDAVVVTSRRFVGPQDQLELLRDFHIGWSDDHGIEVLRERHFRKPDAGNPRGAVGDSRRNASGLEDLLGRKVIAIGVAGALAGNHAHPDACGDALRCALDQRLVEGDRAAGAVLEVKIGVFAASGKRRPEVLLQFRPRDAELLLKELPLWMHRTALPANSRTTVPREDESVKTARTVEQDGHIVSPLGLSKRSKRMGGSKQRSSGARFVRRQRDGTASRRRQESCDRTWFSISGISKRACP